MIVIAICYLNNTLKYFRDRMVVGFTTTHTISVYHNESCEFESRL